jgi:hypothetical protein
MQEENLSNAPQELTDDELEELAKQGFDYGRKENYKKAVAFMRKAAEGGYAIAQYEMGYYYDRGLGVPQDIKTAVEWWHKAAEQGIKNAIFNLAICYESGDGVPCDRKTVLKYYKRGAELGHEKSKQKYEKLVSEINSTNQKKNVKANNRSNGKNAEAITPKKNIGADNMTKKEEEAGLFGKLLKGAGKIIVAMQKQKQKQMHRCTDAPMAMSILRSSCSK